ncbi:MAG: putative LmbE-like protein [Clostridia bacterium]|nr:putative LmbE-like protein [Clostridia bacterium]
MNKLKLMVIGAHPDDCDLYAGGTALKFTEKGHEVKFLSVSNGCCGHQSMGGGALAKRRYEEAQQSAKTAGIIYDLLDIDDCAVVSDLETRKLVTKAIRKFNPDIIITHRPNDYHPDHRNTSMLIQDSAYLLSVPMFCPLTPAMEKMPVIMYSEDSFKRPYPFNADVVLDITDYIQTKARMVDCHKSQFYEWLPWIGGYLKDVPADEKERFEWLLEKIKRNDSYIANRFRSQLTEAYGEQGKTVAYAEAFELSEYGNTPTKEELFKLFNS